MLAMMLAGFLAAAPLDAPRAALLDVLSHDENVACEPAKLRKMVAEAQIRPLGTVAGDRVILAEVYDPCICGAQNCPFYAIRLTPGKPRVLLTAIGVSERNADRATPLPGLIVDAHDSAMVAEETVYAYRNGAYVPAATYRMRGDTHVRKPDSVPVHFAPGASSAQLRGTAALGWYDGYSFAASKGQRVTIDGVRSAAKLTLTLFPPGGGGAITLRAGVPATLPATGAYLLQVENGSETNVPYTLNLSIR